MEAQKRSTRKPSAGQLRRLVKIHLGGQMKSTGKNTLLRVVDDQLDCGWLRDVNNKHETIVESGHDAGRHLHRPIGLKRKTSDTRQRVSDSSHITQRSTRFFWTTGTCQADGKCRLARTDATTVSSCLCRFRFRLALDVRCSARHEARTHKCPETTNDGGMSD